MISRRSFARRGLAFAVASLVVVGSLALALTASANHSQTDLVSIGPTGGNGTPSAGYEASSTDGAHVFFTTTERLVASDTDNTQDIYERFAGNTTLISTGPTGGNAQIDAFFRASSPDGSKVWFETDEALTSTDTDSFQDVYVRSAGTTTEVSLGQTGGNGATEAFFGAASSDGSKVYFLSYENLTSDDTDLGYRDVFLRSSGSTSLVSTGPTGGSGPYNAQLINITPDGAHAYFHTDEPLVSADTDGGAQDVYDRSSGVTTFISTGPTDNHSINDDAVFDGATANGAHVFFETRGPLTSTDTDAKYDVYDRTGSTLTEISLGATGGNGAFDATLRGFSSDGGKVWLETNESLVAGDADGNALDVYEHSGSSTTLISSGGNGNYNAFFGAAAQDGSKVFFQTNEPLLPSDTDASQDIYQNAGGTLSHVSIGGNSAHSADLVKVSNDGARVFFHTYESLVPSDADSDWLDVYERYIGNTYLISTGPASTNAQTVAIFNDATPDGLKAFFQTDQVLTTADTDTSEDVYQSSVVLAPYARPKAANPVRVPLVPAYQPCTTGTANSNHGAPLSFPSCNPPTQSSSVLTVGSPDANGFAAASISSLKYRPTAPPSQQLFVDMAVTDVRCRQTNAACPGGFGTDYTGKLLVKARIRLTDKNNGSPSIESATTQDFDLQVPLQCNATATADGGSCTTSTSVNALFPGAVVDGKRAMWQMDDIKVLDPGPNGTGFDTGCPSACGDGDEAAFMTSGVFVP